MGLPDVAPLQEEMLRELKERTMANVASLQPSELLKAWFPMGIDGWLPCKKSSGAR